MNHESPSLLRPMHILQQEEKKKQEGKEKNRDEMSDGEKSGGGGFASASASASLFLGEEKAHERGSSGQQMQPANACTWIP